MRLACAIRAPCAGAEFRRTVQPEHAVRFDAKAFVCARAGAVCRPRAGAELRRTVQPERAVRFDAKDFVCTSAGFGDFVLAAHVVSCVIRDKRSGVGTRRNRSSRRVVVPSHTDPGCQPPVRPAGGCRSGVQYGVCRGLEHFLHREVRGDF